MPALGVRGNFACFIANPIGYLQRLHDQYGDIASLARGTSRYVFVFSPGYNKAVLGDTDLFYNLDATSSPVRMREKSSLSRLYAGLTNMNGDRHRRQRRLMSSTLRRANIEGYSHDIVAITECQLANWRVGDEVDLLAEMRALTLAVAVKALLGLQPDQEGLGMSRLLQQWMDTVFSVMALALPLDVPGLPYHRLLVQSRRLEDAIKNIIARRRAGAADNNDVLSCLASANDYDGSVLTDDELVGQTAFLFMAGHATTASALTWTLLLLCATPGVLRDVLDELDGVLHGKAPSSAQLANLDLLERVIKESMRLLPPVMWWSRVSTAPVDIGPYRVPAGAHVIYSSYITHRIPELYPRPHKFLPERWLTNNPGPYEYLPFSAGPRMCLGAGFAMLEMKIVLAILLQRWGLMLRTGSRVDIGGLMVSYPKGGLRVALGRPTVPTKKIEIRGNLRTIVDLG